MWANDTAGNTANAVTVSFTIEVLPPTLLFLSPINTTYFSQIPQININLDSPDLNIDKFWYRLYNETDGGWVDSTNITWTSPIQKTLGKGGVYTLYAWANDTLGCISSMINITFTMYHEIIYSGNHVFTSTFTVDTYQKVFFQNGEFSFTSGNLTVKGIVEMTNVTWTSDLTIDANSVINAIDVTMNNGLYIYGDSIASLSNVTLSDEVDLYDNSIVSLTDAIISDYIDIYDFVKLILINSSIYYLRSYENSEVNITLCSLSTALYCNDWSSVTVTTKLDKLGYLSTYAH
ncbi:MAG: hypothetical protein ACFFD2_09150 [Promethearchaeota archaeon]